MLRLLLLLACVSLWVPAASGQGEAQRADFASVSPNAAFSQIEVRLDLAYDSSQREALSKALDTDQDDIITASEEYAYESKTNQVFFEAQGTRRDMGPRRIILDGESPRRATNYTDLQHVTGPADDWDDWIVTEVRLYELSPQVRDTHRVEGGSATAAEEGATSALIRAPRGWFVHRIDGTLHDTSEVSMAAFDPHRPFTIDYADAPGKDYVVAPTETSSPGFEVVAVLGAIVLVAAIAFARGSGRSG